MRKLTLLLVVLAVSGCGLFPAEETTTTNPTVWVAPTTTAATVELPSAPSCSAYTGAGTYEGRVDLEGYDLLGVCIWGRNMVRAQQDCMGSGRLRPDECLELVRAPESEGGYGFTGYSELDVTLMFAVGTDVMNRREVWERRYFDPCVEEHGEDVCRDAFEEERVYYWPDIRRNE